MRFVKVLSIALFAIFVAIGAARATVLIHIDLSTQRMHVQSSSGSYSWPVSTARSGYVTPRGNFAPTSLQKMHYSRKYHNSPMPHSIFFNGGYAIHGTYATRALGRPASHGCVRLSPGNAAALYKMVQREGASISITGSSPQTTRFAARSGEKRHHHHVAGLKSRQKHANPLAYAPGNRYRRTVSNVRVWQGAPFYNPFGF